MCRLQHKTDLRKGLLQTYKAANILLDWLYVLAYFDPAANTKSTFEKVELYRLQKLKKLTC